MDNMRRFKIYLNRIQTGEGVRWSNGLYAFRLFGEGSNIHTAGVEVGTLLQSVWDK